MTMRVPWLSTTLSYDCGPACLAMILSYHGRDTSVDEIRARLGTSRDGTTGLDLARVARGLGVEARGVKVAGPGALTEVPLPAIAHYSKGHFVVVERVRPGRAVRVVDPLRGRIDLPLDEFLDEFSGVALLLRPSPEFTPERGKAWSRFLRMAARGNAASFARLSLLTLLLQAFSFALPAAVAFVVDSVIPSRSVSALGILLAGAPVLMAAYALAAWVRGSGMAALQWRVSRAWLDRIFLHLLRLPLTFFHGRPVPELLMRVQGADAIVDEILDQTISAILDSILAATALVALLATYPAMSGLVIGAALLQALLTWASLRATFDDFIRDVLAHARLYSFGAEALSGIADLKMVGIDRITPSWARLLDERVAAGLAKKRRGALWEGLVGAAQTAAPLLVLGGGAALAVEGTLTVGAVVGFYSLAGVALSPISRLAGSAYRFRSTAEYIRRMWEILGTEAERTGPRTGPGGPTAAEISSAGADASSLEGALALRGVEFRYAPESDPVLSGIDLDVSPGETLVIVGRTGSGKSTLAKLLATLYEPTSGEILADGRPAALYDRAALRSRIGAVFQENVLLSGSILDNINLGRDLPISRAYRALAMSCVLNDVKRMPLGFATPVGAGGLHLSGGQRQRLCLARAIAARPAILVLDEATSAVDRITERKIYRHLMRLRCTKIFVTHRLYIAREADRIVVLDGGRIVETGPHEDLIGRGGLYARMWGQKLKDRKEPDPGPA